MTAGNIFLYYMIRGEPIHVKDKIQNHIKNIL